MGRTTSKSPFREGCKDSIPFLFVVVPFGTLFGVFAAEAGLSILETMAFTVTVFAGTAQFAALQLMTEHAPVIIVLISALAVNLRAAMYSASLTPYLGALPLWQRAIVAYFTVDQSYVLSVARFESDPDLPLQGRFWYFLGTCALVAPIWYGASLAGALLGSSIPDAWALDFALPIAFLAVIGPMLRTPAHRVAALVSVVVALLCAGVPYNLGLLVASVCGMMAGARTELILERRGVKV